jgi:hypothetical protein
MSPADNNAATSLAASGETAPHPAPFPSSTTPAADFPALPEKYPVPRPISQTAFNTSDTIRTILMILLNDLYNFIGNELQNFTSSILYFQTSFIINKEQIIHMRRGLPACKIIFPQTRFAALISPWKTSVCEKALLCH